MTDERLVALDTETFLIGPGAVVPRFVCLTYAERLASGIDRRLHSRADAETLPLLQDVLRPGNGVRVVGHNLAFDLAVLADAYPTLVPGIWAKLDAGECSDTMLREMLLNLSTHGRIEDLVLPDGSLKNVSYGLGDLALDYLGVDRKAAKSGAGSWRLRFSELEGVRAADYPQDAREYALDDASDTLDVYVLQGERVETHDGRASLSVESFQTACAYALLRITRNGMRVDADEFRRLEAQLAEDLSERKLSPLFRSGMLRPPVPSVPYVRQDSKARQLVADWTGQGPDDVDFSVLDPRLRQGLVECGVKFKEAVPASKDTDEIKRRVLCLTVSSNRGLPLAKVLAGCKTADDAVAVADRLGVKYKRTDGGGVCTDKVVVSELASLDQKLAPTDEMSPMRCFEYREKLSKMVTTELPRMTWEGRPAEVVHFCYRPLVETGRTSSHATKNYPSANGQNVDPRARSVYVPRPGRVLCSADYATLELVCVAQTTYDLFGASVHRDKINAGTDLHSYLATGLALDLSREFRAWASEAGLPHDREACYPLFKSMEKTRTEWYKDWRDLAKPVGLGLPGGLGPQKLIEIARRDYEVDVVGMAVERFEAHPEEFEPNRTVLFYAKKLHRMAEEDFVWTPQLKGVALAARFKRTWLDTYPEMQQYFAWCKEQRDAHHATIAMPTKDDPENEVEGLCYTSPMGMHRARTTFTAVANGRAMQSPAAEGFKRAVFDVVRACEDPSRGSPLLGTLVVNEVHDEVITDMAEDRAHDLAAEKREIMERAMRTVIRDVRVKVEPCLMRRWRKEAKPVFDSGGRLTVWEPKPKEAA